MRRQRWAAVALALGAMVGGLVLAGFVVLASVGGYDWPDDTVVPADGREHTVRADGGPVWIWIDGSVGSEPTCRAADLVGDALPLRELRAGHARHGKVIDSPARWEFEAPGEHAVVSCEPPGGVSHYFTFVEPAPLVPALASTDSRIVAGLAVAGLGLLTLLALGATALWRRARRRPVERAAAPADRR